MAISTTVKSAAAVVTSLGIVGGGAITLDSRHAPATIVADIGVMEIFDLVELAREDGPNEWICDAIDKKIIEVCSENPDHYLCDSDRVAVTDLKKKAGCE